MTLEESSQCALAAAEAGDLESLREALRARRKAITELRGEPPSEELAARMRAAIEGGAAIGRALFALKQRLGFENARLARFAGGLAVGCGVER